MAAAALNVSFEFFPVSDPDGAAQWWDAVQRLAVLNPRFVSVTYGADGSTRSRTHQCVMRLLRETPLRVAPHLTCVGATREDIAAIARDYWQQGVRDLVALRGDLPPTGAPGSGYAPHPGGYAYASDLVRGLRGVAGFDISVAAYPEGHPETPGADSDLDNLKRKIDAGARRAITQFFFEPDAFLRYRDRCAAAAIDAPIVPGILPITRFAQLLRFAERCGTRVPAWLARRFEGLEDDPHTRQLIAAHVAIEQALHLRAHGVEDFHFYTLNRAELTQAVCHALGLRPVPAAVYASALGRADAA